MLDVIHLTRTFGQLTAVDDVTFTVPAGQMIGFVGGNGAGKTTTMRMIMGLLAPDSGQVNLNGRPITRSDRSRFGYMPEERGLYAKQPILSQLIYLAELKGMTRDSAAAEASGLMARFGLGDRLKDKLEKLSLGNQQRVQIAAAVMADPIGLILDEPFSGLDPKAVDEMAGLLAERASRGVPVLFSSHQLDLIDRLCDGLVILANGRVVAAGTKDDLESRGATKHRLVTDTDAGWVRDVPGLRVDAVDGGTALFEILVPGAGDDLLAQALQRGHVIEFTPVRPTLSEIYREVTA
ncbi:MAG: ATP-binding cassette domain-containing protein [Propionibacteriaceae bacterium]|uniref:ATP-binding cassette domain-containing protein n=1 Tax=Brooklawnia propionicigenes TaxID=3041175 RepID=A0AAN0MI03_9ACTN|nr:ATP-binding cassette domain-containing protein [Brooklawnia sp. SH051]MCB0883744.1 ATP-binding cassette domain-containing protein [Propionibacteriaceae bacterium]MEA5121782.1 ATP-binding cassette domain-containing protein [Propionibacterium sp.]NLI84232.1 ABC transporter ATP-binding protein [Propionibacterium sp.]BEH03029.1 ATP-binding cassette domain-containing protein [Brooklawnia sp. SH051]